MSEQLQEALWVAVIGGLLLAAILVIFPAGFLR